MNPLKVLIDFFSSGWPKDHRKALKKWRYYVLNDKSYKARHGAGHLLFVYDQTIELIEAMHLLLLQNEHRWPRLKNATAEQLAQEKEAWVYFPSNLCPEELANPYSAVKKCFKKISPQQYRIFLHEWLQNALYNSAADETNLAAEIVNVYDNIRSLYSAAWLIHQRETKQTFTHKSFEKVKGEKGKEEKELREKDLQEKEQQESQKQSNDTKLMPLRDINPELSKAQELGLEEVKNLITAKIPSVRLIYLLGTHNDPFTYYLVVLIDDKEKTQEHEIANKIEDTCRYLTSVFAIVHKVRSAKEAVVNGRRFWNNMLYKSICVYEFPGTEIPGFIDITDRLWLERAMQDWDRWGTQGKAFMKGAIWYLENDDYARAMFCLNQAVESSLIAIIRAVLGYRLSAHNLSRMIRMTLLFTEEIKTGLQLNTTEGARLFSLLQSGYSEARYKNHYQPDEESVKQLKEKVDLLLTKTAQVYVQLTKAKNG